MVIDYDRMPKAAGGRVEVFNAVTGRVLVRLPGFLTGAVRVILNLFF